MASARFKSNVSVFQTCATIKNEVNNLGFTVELVGESKMVSDDFHVFMFVYEKFYYRASNRASLSILVGGNANESKVECVSSGAGQGLLFRFSWGADKNFVNGLRRILLSKGYQEY